jgi:tetratricopeptide (TPR) repeat protein
MKIAYFALASMVLLLPARWMEDRYDRADARLEAFYADMRRADLPAARIDIGEAIHLWDWNSRYYAWRGSVVAQTLPAHCSHTTSSRQSLTAKEMTVAQSAIRDYSRALSLNHRAAVAHQNLAWLQHLTADDQAAREHWQAAIRDDPGDAVMHVSYALFLEESGGHAEAQNEVETALELSPSLVDSTFLRDFRSRPADQADALVRLSISRMQTRNDRQADPILEAKLGKLYLFLGDAQHAVTLLRHAVEALPDLPLAWLNLGNAYAILGNTEAATDCYRRSNLLDSLHPGPYFGMARINLVTGHEQAAARYLHRAVLQAQLIPPITAAHQNQLYIGPYQRIDDLLPPVLAQYISPCWNAETALALGEVPFPDEAGSRAGVGDCRQIHSPHSLP